MHEHQRFDDEAATWDQPPGHEERQVAVAKAIEKAVTLRPAMRALEVGGGTGRLSILLSLHGVAPRCRPGWAAAVGGGALAVSKFIEAETGWSIKKFVRTTRRYRTIEIQAGQHTITAADPLPDDVADTLNALRNATRPAH